MLLRSPSAIGMPYGWDADPEGKKELAHLTEHILFSNHDGQTEQEIIVRLRWASKAYPTISYWIAA